MSSIDSPKPLLLRVKRKANEEKTIPNKRCKFVGTTESAKDEDIYRLVANTKSLPQKDLDNTLEIKDYDNWYLKTISRQKDVITCNGQPLDSVENRLEDSLDYIYDIYVVDDKQYLEDEYPIDYRECDDSEEDSNDENYAYNDYPEDNEVSEDVNDYYNYTEDLNDSQIDLRDDFERSNRIGSSDYELSDEDVNELKRYIQKNRMFSQSIDQQYGDDEDEEEEEEF